LLIRRSKPQWIRHISIVHLKTSFREHKAWSLSEVAQNSLELPQRHLSQELFGYRSSTTETMYSRWTRYSNKADVPQDAKCHCLVAKTGEPCLNKPSYLIHATSTWACGRHLQKSLPECSICMCEMSKKTEKLLPCGHVFHDKCLSRWEETTKEPKCPMCRSVYFASGWRPMSLPPGIVLSYDEIGIGSQHTFLLLQSMFMEIVARHHITKPTVRELSREFGPEWYTPVGDFIPAPIVKDGTVCWSQMDRTHPTYQLLGYLENALYSDASFFQESNDDSIP
jgi:hypothetical protein